MTALEPYQAGLEETGKTFELHMYVSVNQVFNNDK